MVQNSSAIGNKNKENCCRRGKFGKGHVLWGTGSCLWPLSTSMLNICQTTQNVCSYNLSQNMLFLLTSFWLTQSHLSLFGSLFQNTVFLVHWVYIVLLVIYIYTYNSHVLFSLFKAETRFFSCHVFHCVRVQFSTIYPPNWSCWLKEENDWLWHVCIC